MSVKDKYYKYKLKYLNAKKQLGSGDFSTIQYKISNEGEILEKKTLHELIGREENDGSYHNYEHIMGVYYERKVCSSFTCKELLSNIEKYKSKLSLNEILKTCLIIDGIEVKNNISEEDFHVTCDQKPNIIILYFADILSAQTYMNIYNNNYEIFPRDILSELFMGLRTMYPPETYVDKSYLFHIFHGIIFSYDIKDIYGFIKEYRDKFGELVKITNPPDEKLQLQLDNLTIINKDNFFQLLSKIIDIIIKASTGLSALSSYAYEIKLVNINNHPQLNFRPITYQKLRHELSEKYSRINK